jgi:hypothetical protein
LLLFWGATKETSFRRSLGWQKRAFLFSMTACYFCEASLTLDGHMNLITRFISSNLWIRCEMRLCH